DPQAAVHPRRLPGADEADPPHGPPERASEDAARGRRPRTGRPEGRRPRPGPPPGDHHLDDARRAGAPGDPQRVPPAPDRARLGHDDPGGEPARQAVRPDAEGDAPAPAGEDAVPVAAGRRSLTFSRLSRPGGL